MKNFNFLRFTVVFAFLGILISSCTKDSLKPSSTQVSKQNQTNDPIGTGSILASIDAPGALRTSMVAINNHDGTTSEEIFADENGIVLIEGLEEGTYTVVVHAYMPFDGSSVGSATDVNDVTITLDDVIVAPDQITDLGKIIFN